MQQTHRFVGEMWYALRVPIRRFQIDNVRGLKHASFESLPDLAVVGGANGVGKSTLLDQLFRRRNEFAEPGTRVLYIGPNRSQRRAPVSAMGLFALQGDLVSSLSMESQPNFSAYIPNDWRWSQGQARGLDSPDESYALVKYEINRLEALRREALSQIHANRGAVPEGAMPDVFGPLRLLTQYLLPHLRFVRVDQADTNNYKCIFSRSDAGEALELDLDDLSSGEKAIIALFMPFLALQIKDLLIAAGVSVPGHDSSQSITALIDEPEIHLHPILQASLVAYLRQLATSGGVQFVLATHSPTMMDAMNEDELFMLVPSELATGGNQFRKVVHADERLEAIRVLTGSTSVITRARPIVFMEGESRTSKTDSDQSLLGLLVPESASWVVVPARGRSEAIRHARQLQETLVSEIPGLPIFALVDSDRLEPNDETIMGWPVAMIENLLLDPAAIWRLLAPHAGRHALTSEAQVIESLDGLARARREDEIRLRVSESLGRLVLSPNLSNVGGTLTLDTERLIEECRAYTDQVSEQAKSAVEEAARVVDEILDNRRHLERFRGKQLLNDFYQQAHLGGILSKPAFTVELSRHAASGERLTTLVSGPVARIQRYVPSRLVEVLNGLGLHEESVFGEAIAMASSAVEAWRNPDLERVDLDALRAVIHQVVRLARDKGHSAAAEELAVLVPRFGLSR